ncbi:acyltransferase domain-containing protein [Streptacidiphilus sp. 4-A2]|nr:acyltransferase domain-containing protein [Streptacidiphilus sp. 4-A2]
MDWSDGEARLLTDPAPWPTGGRPRRAGVSAFSGTNAHVIVEEAPGDPEPAAAENRPQLLLGAPQAWLLSARTAEALAAQAGRLASRVRGAGEPDPADIGWSLATTRSVFEHRAVVLGANLAELLSGTTALAAGGPAAQLLTGEAPGPRTGRVGFLFAGQGAQRAGMGRELYAASPVFAAAFDRVAGVLEAELGLPLREVVLGAGDDERADQTVYAQTGLFAVEVGLVAVLAAAGIVPDAVAGHSVGEIAAAHAVGVLSLEDACALVAARARLMQALPAGGAMAAVAASEAEVLAALVELPGVSLAAVNGPESVVVSGDEEAVDATVELWRERGRRVRRLRVSHAFHSARMDPVLDELGQLAAGLRLRAPALPWVGALTGARVTARSRGTGRPRPGSRSASRTRSGPWPGSGSRCSSRSARTAPSAPWARPPWARPCRDPPRWARPRAGFGRAGRRSQPGRGGGVHPGAAPEDPGCGLGADRAGPGAPPWGGRRLECRAALRPPDRPADLRLRPQAPVGGHRGAPGRSRCREPGRGSGRGAVLGGGRAGRPGRTGRSPGGGRAAAVQRGAAGAGVLAAAGAGGVGGRRLALPDHLDAVHRPGAGPADRGLAAGDRSGRSRCGRGVRPGADRRGRPDRAARAEAGVDREALADAIGAACGGAGAQPPAGVLSLLAADEAPLPGHPEVSAGLAATVGLVQALGDAGVGAPLWVLTRGAVAAGAQQELSRPVQAQVWGLGRVVGMEHPDRWGGLIDLPPDLDERAGARLAGVLAGCGEDQVAVRSTGVLARRLVRAPRPLAATAAGTAVTGRFARGSVLVTGAPARSAGRWPTGWPRPARPGWCSGAAPARARRGRRGGPPGSPRAAPRWPYWPVTWPAGTMWPGCWPGRPRTDRR